MLGHSPMGIRTGRELLESLRDGRQLFIDGERVEDVTSDPLCNSSEELGPAL